MIDLPQPVASYLTNPDIAAAVDAIVKGKERLPNGLTWAEMEAYYEAVGAAHIVRVNWAVALQRLWNDVWADALSGLTPVAPAENASVYRSNTPADCWEDDGFGRCFVLNPDQWLWAEVQFDRDHTYISASVDGVTQRAMLRALPNMEKCSEEWVEFRAGPLLGKDDPSADLRDAACQIVAAAVRLTGKPSA